MSTLLLTSATQAEKKAAAAASEKVPLEKKLDKRGLLNLGYGYGINGLDVGYLGKSDHFAPSFGPSYGSYGGYGGYAHAAPAYGAYGGFGPYVADVTKTVTLVKGVPVPVEKPVPYPVTVEKHVPYPVKVAVGLIADQPNRSKNKRDVFHRYHNPTK